MNPYPSLLPVSSRVRITHNGITALGTVLMGMDASKVRVLVDGETKVTTVYPEQIEEVSKCPQS